jgi:hypothetical protein
MFLDLWDEKFRQLLYAYNIVDDMNFYLIWVQPFHIKDVICKMGDFKNSLRHVFFLNSKDGR